MVLHGSLIGRPANVTVDVVEAARWMGGLTLTFGVVIDLVVVFDGLSVAGFPEGKLSYND